MSEISVAMATYNGSRYLQQQLASIAGQTRLPAELVVTDDGSTDDTLRLAADFAASAPFPVHIHRNAQRLGYRRNFLSNALLCRGDLIAFCDQDDIWRPDKLQRAAEALQNPDTILFYHNAELIDAAGASLGSANMARAPRLNPPSSLHPYTWGLGLVQVFRRSLTGFDDLWAGSMDAIEPHNRMSHDMWIFFLASTFGQIAYSDEKLIGYRQHGSNTVGFNSHGSKWDQMKATASRGAGEYDRLAKASWNRQAILDAAQGRLDGDWRRKAAAGAALYTQCARRFELRAKVYSDPHFTVRGRSLLALLRDRAYGVRNAWGFSYRSLVKDAIIAGAFGAVAAGRQSA